MASPIPLVAFRIRSGNDFEAEDMILSRISVSFAARMIPLGALYAIALKALQKFGIRVGMPAETAPTPAKASVGRIINDYGALMQCRPPRSTRIEDVSVLPHSKEVILEALLSQIGKDQPKHMDDMLRVGAIYLAQYQSGVGDEPLENLSMIRGKLPRANGLDEIRAEAGKRERFDQFNRLVESDLRRISLRIADIQS
jgi:hypothetical protein